MEFGRDCFQGRPTLDYLNGALITHVTKRPFTEAGYIGFQVESGPVYWRNIRIRAD